MPLFNYVFVQHCSTWKAYDAAFPSDHEIAGNHNCNTDQFWLHAPATECDMIGTDALRELWEGVFDDGFAQSYAKSIIWQVPIAIGHATRGCSVLNLKHFAIS